MPGVKGMHWNKKHEEGKKRNTWLKDHVDKKLTILVNLKNSTHSAEIAEIIEKNIDKELAKFEKSKKKAEVGGQHV